MERTISVADYFVEFLIANGVTDVFGYQGGMIAYIFDSLGKYRAGINYHSCATEQGAALAACGYAQATGRLGVAISTSGPGFTNLLTGMADAWFDSVPVLFVSGNVNTKDKKRERPLRQMGFQEIQAVPIAAAITKKTYEMEIGSDCEEIFQDAYTTAMTHRRGPVFIDFPINICREKITINEVKKITIIDKELNIDVRGIIRELKDSRRPVIIAGAGIKQASEREQFRDFINMIKIPVLTTLPAIDVMPTNSKYMMGYIGGTGRREGGIVLQNADFVLTIGTRLCSKQIGHDMSLFAPKVKKLIRIDIDENELGREVKTEELQIKADISIFLRQMTEQLRKENYLPQHGKWSDVCESIYNTLGKFDMTPVNQFIRKLTMLFPEKANILIDVGKNMTYFGQSSQVKEGTKVYMSAGLGTMGYALPAAIGAYYGNHFPTFVIVGDGGAQMNIQELNTIVKNDLPIKIVVLNNKALGNIRIFQEQYLDSRFVATDEREGDYFSCDFVAIAKAYGVEAYAFNGFNDVACMETYLNKAYGACLAEVIYEDCEVLPGIVAGGEYLKEETGIPQNVLKQIRDILEM